MSGELFHEIGYQLDDDLQDLIIVTRLDLQHQGGRHS
jgi:hypothetical protein